MADGVDLRPLPLRDRKAALARIGARATGWLPLTNGVVGDGRALYRAVGAADLEGIVAQRLSDPYHPQRTRWHKILNQTYSHAPDNAEAAKLVHRPERRLGKAGVRLGWPGFSLGCVLGKHQIGPASGFVPPWHCAWC